MTHSMDGYDDPWGTGREPTDAELDTMNREPSETAHERDRQWPTSTPTTVPRQAQTAVSAPAHEGPNKVVQVRIAGAGKRTYAYEVPARIHAVTGDWVALPGNVVSEDGSTGKVVSYGRDGYGGPLKEITAVVPEPSVWMMRMLCVKTRPTAAKIYDEAVAAGVSGDELAAVVLAGTRRLRQLGVQR